MADCLRGIPMSRSDTGVVTLAALEDTGIDVSLVPDAGRRGHHRRHRAGATRMSARRSVRPRRRGCYQFVRMKWLSSSAPTTLSASHQRCDRGGSSAPAAVEPHRERQPDAFGLGLAQHGQVRGHDRQQRAEHHEVQPGAPLDRRDVEQAADTGHAPQPDRAHHRGEVRPRPSTGTAGRWRCPASSVPAPACIRRTTRTPRPRTRRRPLARQAPREPERARRPASPRLRSAPPPQATPSARGRSSRRCPSRAGARTPRRPRIGQPRRAPNRQRQQCDAPRRDACEVAVGGHRDPDGRRRHRDERRHQTSGVLVGQRAHRHHDRGRGAGPDQQAQQSCPRAAAQARCGPARRTSAARPADGPTRG